MQQPSPPQSAAMHLTSVPTVNQLKSAIESILRKGFTFDAAVASIKEMLQQQHHFSSADKDLAYANLGAAISASSEPQQPLHENETVLQRSTVIQSQPVVAAPRAEAFAAGATAATAAATTTIQYREPSRMVAPSQHQSQRQAEPVGTSELRIRRAGTIAVPRIDVLGEKIQEAWNYSMSLKPDAVRYLGGATIPSAEVPRWFLFRYWRDIGKVKFEKLLGSKNDLIQMGAPKSIHISQESGEVHVLIVNPNCQGYLWLENYISESYQKPGQPIVLRCGITTTGEILEFPLIHVLVGGMPRQGKSSTQAMLLAQCIGTHAPYGVRDERGASAGLRIMLVETAKQVEANKFQDSVFLWNYQDGLPTGRFETGSGIVRTKEEFLAMLNDGGALMSLFKYREALFKQNNVSSIDEWNLKFGPAHQMFRLVVSIEEYSSMVQEENPRKDALHHRLGSFMQLCPGMGIHFIIGCHRPEHDILHSRIRSSLDTRISMACACEADYRIVLGIKDTKIAIPELPGQGTMLVRNGAALPDICQGFYVSREQIENMIVYTNDLYRR